METGIKLNKNYDVEFVSIFDNKPNIVIVSGTGIHVKTSKQIQDLELAMKKKQEKYNEMEREQRPEHQLIPKKSECFFPEVHEMVLVANSKWTGVRRAIVIEVFRNPEDLTTFSLYLYDHGTKHFCSRDDISRIPKKFIGKRPAVYRVTVEQVFPTVVCLQENRIEWAKHALGLVHKWFLQRRKLCMRISFIANGYELIGDFGHYLSDDFGSKMSDNYYTLAEFMLSRKAACVLPQYKKLLTLTNEEVMDENLLPKIPVGKHGLVLKCSDIILEDIEYNNDEDDDKTITTTSTDPGLKMPPTKLKNSIHALLKRRMQNDTNRGNKTSNFPKDIPEHERYVMMLEWGVDEEDLEEGNVIQIKSSDGTSHSFSSGYPRSRGSTSHDEI